MLGWKVAVRHGEGGRGGARRTWLRRGLRLGGALMAPEGILPGEGLGGQGEGLTRAGGDSRFDMVVVCDGRYLPGGGACGRGGQAATSLSSC